MSTSQIKCCINCSSTLRQRVIGVYAADQLPMIEKSEAGFIANTDNHFKSGQYWCSFYFPISDTVEYFDTFGKPIDFYNNEFPIFMSNFTTLFGILSNYKVREVICLGCIVCFSC